VRAIKNCFAGRELPTPALGSRRPQVKDCWHRVLQFLLNKYSLNILLNRIKVLHISYLLLHTILGRVVFTDKTKTKNYKSLMKFNFNDFFQLQN
jgi:hypothetical protein